MSKKVDRPLRRHKDDGYWDRVEVLARDVTLLATIVPRYKTSGLSGDEWRISARLQVEFNSNANVLIDRCFHSMRHLTEYSPIFLYRQASACLNIKDATLTAYRKGHALTKRQFPTFGEAAIGIGWHIVTANEGEPGVDWRHLTDEEERSHCQQVGCWEHPVNVYRLKKILYGKGPKTFMVPQYDFEGQFVWYCARHTTRGDCGFEDADKNLELIEGDGGCQGSRGG